MYLVGGVVSKVDLVFRVLVCEVFRLVYVVVYVFGVGFGVIVVVGEEV